MSISKKFYAMTFADAIQFDLSCALRTLEGILRKRNFTD
jgi:hypothetical protein